MIKIENVSTAGFEPAVRGMRNPMNSWERSDSQLCKSGDGFEDCRVGVHGDCPRGDEDYFKEDIFCVGKNDFELMQRLARAGTDHRKFMRMIVVYADITAPLYWWKEFDTYKVGTVANSESTMHTIMKKPFVRDIFSFDKVGNVGHWSDVCDTIINELNELRELYLMAVRDKESGSARAYWKILIELLPNSFNQKRTVHLNYEVLAKIWKERKNHKLSEWSGMLGFCQNFIKSLPYSELITGEEKLND